MYVTTEEVRTEVKIINQEIRILAKEVNDNLQSMAEQLNILRDSLEQNQIELNRVEERLETLEKNNDNS